MLAILYVLLFAVMKILFLPFFPPMQAIFCILHLSLIIPCGGKFSGFHSAQRKHFPTSHEVHKAIGEVVVLRENGLSVGSKQSFECS